MHFITDTGLKYSPKYLASLKEKSQKKFETIFDWISIKISHWQNWQDATVLSTAVISVKFIALQAYVRKKARLKMNNIKFFWKSFKQKEKKKTLQRYYKKEINKLRIEINKITNIQWGGKQTGEILQKNK